MRGIDHLVLVAHDLDALGRRYEALGFRVGAENRHDWGTLNRIVQFDGCFLELLTTEDAFERPDDTAPVAQFAGVIDDYLDQREGFAMLVLESGDAVADHDDFTRRGIGAPSVFQFSRAGRTPDGRAVTVSFSLAFARPSQPSAAGYFVCQQHAPDLFWNPAFQQHPNGAKGVAGVVFQAAAPDAFSGFFGDFTGVGQSVTLPGGWRIETPRGAIDCLDAQGVEAIFGAGAALPGAAAPGFAGVRFAVEDLGVCQRVLASGGITHCMVGGRLVVPPGEAVGVALAFETV
ncbi:MAG: VOC family protein [Hyphomicrobiaceae bacterium]|nr:VOC family protein [Hyphomicrobiaceae bacterium]